MNGAQAAETRRIRVLRPENKRSKLRVLVSFGKLALLPDGPPFAQKNTDEVLMEVYSLNAVFD